MRKIVPFAVVVFALFLLIGMAHSAEAETLTKTFGNQGRITTVFNFGTAMQSPQITVEGYWCYEDGGGGGCFQNSRTVAAGVTGLMFSFLKDDGGRGTPGPNCVFYTGNPSAYDYCMDIISSQWDGQRLTLDWEGKTDRDINFTRGVSYMNRISVSANPLPLPSVSLQGTPTTITSGSSATLSWTSQNATVCVASNGWIGVRATSGSETVSPTQNASFALTCSNGAGQSDSRTIFITVNAPPQQPTPVTIALSANATQIIRGSSATLTWNTTGATSCASSGGWSGLVSTSGSQTVTPQQTSSYNLICGNSGTTAQANITITVTDPSPLAPTVNITISVSQITQGGSATLSWTSTNATSCTASNGWSGIKPLSGNEIVFPTQTTIYSITCSNATNQVTDSKTVFVQNQNQANQPTITLSANPGVINQGGSATLSWTSANATSCAVSDGWSGFRPLSGNETVFPTYTTAYSITCSNATRQTTDSKTVVVQNQNQANQPTITFSANPGAMNQGGSVSLSWNANNANSCFGGSGWSGVKSLVGSETVYPGVTTTYTLTCTGNNGTATESRTVYVVSSSVTSNSIRIEAAIRNVTLQQGEFSDSVEAQGLDTVELRFRIWNNGTNAIRVTVRDTLPPELSYNAGTTQIQNVPAPEGIISSSGGISLGGINPGEQKTVTLKATIVFNATAGSLRNEFFATSEFGTQTSGNTIQVRPRGRVLGAATVVTGAENILPWTILLGFFGSVGAYIGLFKYRFRNLASKKSLIAEMRFRSRLKALRKKEKSPDDTTLFL